MLQRLLLVRVLAFLLLPSAAAAQFTQVSGTITDPNGLPYAYGTIAPSLVVSRSPVITATGFGYTPPTQPVGLDKTGSFIMQLANAASLTPSGSTWSFTVCAGTGLVQPSFGKGPICFTVTGITISGSSQSLTSTLTAAAPALTVNFGGGGGGVTGSGTAGFISEWTGSTALGNSPIDDSAGALTSSENITAPVVNTTTGFELGGAAPNGHVLCGNGTDYVDASSCGASGGISGSGTIDFVPIFTGATAIGNSLIQSGAAGSRGAVSIGNSAPAGPINNLLVIAQPLGACTGNSTFPGPTVGCFGQDLQFTPENATSIGTTVGLRASNNSNISSETLAIGLYAEAAAGNNITTEIGAYSEANDTIGITVGTRRGLYALAGNGTGHTTATNEAILAETFVNSGSTNTADYGIHIASPAFVGGTNTLTTHVGLQIDDQTAGGSQNPSPFGIVESGTAPNTFGGNIAAPIFNATTGFQIGGLAPSGHVPCGNGTNYVDASSCGGAGGVTQFASVAGCTASGSVCTVTVTWPSSFADTSYTVMCGGVGPLTGQPQAAFVYPPAAPTSVSSQIVDIDNRGTTNPGGFTTVVCWGHHS